MVHVPSFAAAETEPWWNESFEYRQRLIVSNNGSEVLPQGYSVGLRFDHKKLMDDGKSLQNGDDVRVVYWDGSEYVELDRVNESRWGGLGNQALVWFRTQSEISAGGADSSYFLYYGNPSAGTPPADRSRVYLLSDDFSEHPLGPFSAQGWTVQSGSWNVELDTQSDGTMGNVLSHDSDPPGSYKYAYVDSAQYGDVVVEVKMRVKTGESSNYFPFGARLDRSTGASYCAFGYAATTKLFEFPGWTLVPTQLGSTGSHGTMGNAWHTVQFKLSGVTNFKLNFDGKDIIADASDSAPPTLASGCVYLMGYVGQKIHFDDFRVRKYVSSEPGVAARSEQKLGAKPIVTLGRHWFLRGDAFTAADTSLDVTTCLPDSEQALDPVAQYQIVGPNSELSGGMNRISLGTWQARVDLSGLLPGSYSVVATMTSSGQQNLSDPVALYVSYALYHVWTIDWEGSYVSKSFYLDSLGALADRHGTPMTQLFNPRIYVLQGMPEWQRIQVTQWVLNRAASKGDEIGMHLHMYNDFVQAAGLTPLTQPQWSTRSDGYDVPFSAYDYSQSLALINLGVSLFRAKGLGTPLSFRAGGCFADEDNLRALSELDFLDTSGSPLGNFGSLQLPWSVTPSSQPYYPCLTDQNVASCGADDYNLTLLEIPDNLGISDDSHDMRPMFDANYTGEPLGEVRTAVLVSHDRSGVGDEAALLEQYFSYVDCFTHASDRGPVIYVNLRDVKRALSFNAPYTPDSLGPEEFVTGISVPTATPTLTFRVRDREPLSAIRYRIVISASQDYNPVTGIVADYISGLGSSGLVSFTVGQSSSGGSYVSGHPGQSLAEGVYYWKVMAITDNGACSAWQLADGGERAFRVTPSIGVAEVDGRVAAGLGVTFSNPCGPGVLMKLRFASGAASAAGSPTGGPTLNIVDCSGRLIRTLLGKNVRTAGESWLSRSAAGQRSDGSDATGSGSWVEASVSWDGRDSNGRRVSSGVYFVELEQGDWKAVKKIVLIQ